MNIEDTLSSLKKKIDSINTKKIENATKLSGLEQEKETLLAECQKLGVDPANLEKIVVDEETKLNSEIAKLESEIGNVYDSISKF
jgi:prefoldin subunit 5